MIQAESGGGGTHDQRPNVSDIWTVVCEDGFVTAQKRENQLRGCENVKVKTHMKFWATSSLGLVPTGFNANASMPPEPRLRYFFASS